MKLRIGTTDQRIIYIQLDDVCPSDDDPVVGLIDTPYLAELMVMAFNEHMGHRLGHIFGLPLHNDDDEVGVKR